MELDQLRVHCAESRELVPHLAQLATHLSLLAPQPFLPPVEPLHVRDHLCFDRFPALEFLLDLGTVGPEGQLRR